MQLSSTLQRRLIDGLLDDHPLPWRINHETQQEFLCEVIDAKKKSVLICMTEVEAAELIDAAMAATTDNAKTETRSDRDVFDEKVLAIKPKTASDLFDKLLPLVLSRKPDQARAIAATYGFKITGANGGEWSVDCSASGTPSCRPGDAATAMCMVTVSSEDFMNIMKDPKSAAMQLYFQGKLVVSGDAALAMKLPKLFDLLPQ